MHQGQVDVTQLGLLERFYQVKNARVHCLTVSSDGRSISVSSGKCSMCVNVNRSADNDMFQYFYNNDNFNANAIAAHYRFFQTHHDNWRAPEDTRLTPPILRSAGNRHEILYLKVKHLTMEAVRELLAMCNTSVWNTVSGKLTVFLDPQVYRACVTRTGKKRKILDEDVPL